MRKRIEKKERSLQSWDSHSKLSCVKPTAVTTELGCFIATFSKVASVNILPVKSELLQELELQEHTRHTKV